MPKKRTHEEFVELVKIQRNNEYTVLSEYKNSGTKVLMRHNCDKCSNYEWEVTPESFLGSKNKKGSGCPVCSEGKRVESKKIPYEKVKEFIEIDSKSDCKLITPKDKYVKANSHIWIKCKCGKEFKTTFIEFKSSNKRQCNDCGEYIRTHALNLKYDYVKEQIENEGFELLSDEYFNVNTTLKMKCSNEHIFDKSYNDFRNGSRCPICTYESGFRNYPYTIEEIRTIIEKEGYKLLSTKYINKYEKLIFKCPKGHEFSMCWDCFYNQKQRCPICYKENKFNPYMPINSYLRGKINQWKIDSAKNCNYKCVITGQPMDDIHHLYSFQDIVIETLETLGYEVLDVGEYSKQQLDEIEKRCLELHYDYGLGVCLSRNVHRKFHVMYGLKTNKKQFYDFINKINNKEIKLEEAF